MDEKTVAQIFGYSLQSLEYDAESKIRRVTFKDNTIQVTFDLTPELELPLMMSFPPIEDWIESTQEKETRPGKLNKFITNYCRRTGTYYRCLKEYNYNPWQWGFTGSSTWTTWTTDNTTSSSTFIPSGSLVWSTT